ncbi:hypothetical protein CJ030_MR2G003997 [Morella rubra]|uniref:RNase H type-1 domain-containing protein n=1 Tax=Morella rubra TaxID=262757 RepID=A0A6A1WAD9_9ROSI|nr:hypothetical protein CJ030_MR2G003997 [Morella rubra]
MHAAKRIHEDIGDIYNLLLKFQQSKFSHIPRDANSVAHQLARWTASKFSSGGTPPAPDHNTLVYKDIVSSLILAGRTLTNPQVLETDERDRVSEGRFGRSGGKDVPEVLIASLNELEAEFNLVLRDAEFQVRFRKKEHIQPPNPMDTYGKKKKVSSFGPSFVAGKHALTEDNLGPGRLKWNG